jgi:hypothetical protein
VAFVGSTTTTEGDIMLALLLALALHAPADHHWHGPWGPGGFGENVLGYPTQIVGGVTYQVLPNGQLVAVPVSTVVAPSLVL